MKDLRKTDDYMGRAFLSLWTLKQVQGKEMELFSHSGKSPYGSIIVDLSVEQVKKNTSLEVSLWQGVAGLGLLWGGLEVGDFIV